jgi:hypothetical protein
MELDSEIRHALSAAIEHGDHDSHPMEHRVVSIVRRGRRVRRHRRLATGSIIASSVMAISVGVATTMLRHNDDHPIDEVAGPTPTAARPPGSSSDSVVGLASSTNSPPPSGPTVSSADFPTVAAVGGGWTLLPEAPIAATENPVVVATDAEVLVFGGAPQSSWLTSGVVTASSPNGAMYNVDTGRWRSITPDPVGWRSNYSWSWDARYLYVFGGSAPSGDGFGLATYDSQTDTWTDAGRGPLSARQGATMVWTGTEVLIGGGYELGLSLDRPMSGGAAYNPQTERWRSIAPSDALNGSADSYWLGDQWLVRSGRLGALRLDAYDPARDDWTNIAHPLGLPVDSLFHINVRNSSVVLQWFGTTTGEMETSPASAKAILRAWQLDVGSGEWQPLDTLPDWLSPPPSIHDGGVIVAGQLGTNFSSGVSLDRLGNDRVVRFSDQGWEQLPPSPLPNRLSTSYIELPGGRLFGWGGSTYDRESLVMVSDGAIYEPDATTVDVGEVVQGNPCTFDSVLTPTVSPGSTENSFDVALTVRTSCDVWGFPVLLNGLDDARRSREVATHRGPTGSVSSVTGWTPGVSLQPGETFVFTLVERQCAPSPDDDRLTRQSISAVQFRLPRTSTSPESRAPNDPDFSAPTGPPIEIKTPFVQPIRCLAVTGFRAGT